MYLASWSRPIAGPATACVVTRSKDARAAWTDRAKPGGWMAALAPGESCPDSLSCPDSSAGGLEFREVGLPDPVPAGGWVVENLAAQLGPGPPIDAVAAGQQ